MWARFSDPVQNDPGGHPTSYTTRTGSFPGVKRPWRGVDHQPPTSALWTFAVCSKVNFIISLCRGSFVVYALLGTMGLISFVRNVGKKLSIKYILFVPTLA